MEIFGYKITNSWLKNFPNDPSNQVKAILFDITKSLGNPSWGGLYAWQQIIRKEIVFTENEPIHLQLFKGYNRIKKGLLDDIFDIIQAQNPHNVRNSHHNQLLKAIVELAINKTCKKVVATADDMKGLISVAGGGIDYLINVETSLRRLRGKLENEKFYCTFTLADASGLNKIEELIENNTNLVILNFGPCDGDGPYEYTYEDCLDDFSFDAFRKKLEGR